VAGGGPHPDSDRAVCTSDATTSWPSKAGSVGPLGGWLIHAPALLPARTSRARPGAKLGLHGAGLAYCIRDLYSGVRPGAMAQLVARLHGMQKVRGSSPLSSTRSEA
jgi:hypothetical protein